MECGSFFESLFPFFDIAYDSAANPQPGILLKLIEALFKIIRAEGKVAVEFGNELPIAASQCSISIVKRVHDAAPRFSKTPVLAVYRPYPWVTTGILVDDLPRAIFRAIVYDHPFFR
jgi:hypothetical protein